MMIDNDHWKLDYYLQQNDDDDDGDHHSLVLQKKNYHHDKTKYESSIDPLMNRNKFKKTTTTLTPSTIVVGV